MEKQTVSASLLTAALSIYPPVLYHPMMLYSRAVLD